MAHDKHDDAPAPKTSKAKPAAPHRDETGKLTFEGMEAVIAEGGSVLHGGRVISRVSDLPSRADLVKGNAAQEKALEDHLDAEIGKLTAQKAKMKTPASEPKRDR